MSKKRKKIDRERRRRTERRTIAVICGLLGLIILGLGCYAAGWYANRARLERDIHRYQSMYRPEATPEVTSTSTPSPTPTPAITTTPAMTASAAPDTSPTETLKPSRVPESTQDPVVIDVPIPTADAGTVVLSLPTPPPVQSSFAQLLEHNPDTVGYLDIPDMLSLPVVWRENDNDFYLTHNFDGKESSEGTLFLDGVNRLAPEDDCLIVYGHNMKNGAMFAPLSRYEDRRYAENHAEVRFDTLYENRRYVPFAAFTASMDPSDEHYFDVRKFIFDETSFELFTLRLMSRSEWRSWVDVRYGDRLLLLVTCDYQNRQGRFILALRQVREDE